MNLDPEMVQVTDIKRRRIRLTRGYNGTRAKYHEGGPWMIVMSPTSANDDLGPDRPADLYHVSLELPDFSNRVHWLTVHSDVAAWLAVGYVLVEMLRVGDPNPDGRWDRA